jgi:hypothetical protein
LKLVRHLVELIGKQFELVAGLDQAVGAEYFDRQYCPHREGPKGRTVAAVEGRLKPYPVEGCSLVPATMDREVPLETRML